MRPSGRFLSNDGLVPLTRTAHQRKPPSLPRKHVPETVLASLQALPTEEKYNVRKGYNLYGCLARLPGQGVGLRIYKRKWEMDGLDTNSMTGTYWHVVRTEFDTLPTTNKKSVKKAWGIKYVGGRQITPPNTIVQIEDPDMLWLPCDMVPGGTTSNTFYINEQIKHLGAQDYGTDPESARVVDDL